MFNLYNIYEHIYMNVYFVHL